MNQGFGPSCPPDHGHDHRYEIGFEINRLSIEIRRCLDSRLTGYGLDAHATPIQTHIIGYLATHEDQEIYQKTLEAAFGTRRSTISSILQLMEKNDLIRRTSVPGDARLKKIVLSDRGREIFERTGCEIRHLEQTLAQNLSQEEITRFFHIMGIIRNNLKGGNYD